MMRVSVKNNSPALQGVSTLAGTKWIKPGTSQTIEVADTRQLERLPFLEVSYSDAGVPVGDLPPPPKSLLDKVKADDRPEVSMALKKAELVAIAEAEGVEFESDDNKADLIRKIVAARQ